MAMFAKDTDMGGDMGSSSVSASASASSSSAAAAMAPDEAERAVPFCQCSAQVFDIGMHPSQSMVAAGLVDGSVEVFRYDAVGTAGDRRIQFAYRPHSHGCRRVLFHSDGINLFSASADQSIVSTDLNTQSTTFKVENAHSEGVNTLFFLQENVLASGGDDGSLKLWDIRTQACVHQFKEHDDYISDITCNADGSRLVTVGGDGRLAVYNVWQNKLVARSDILDDELLSVCIIKGGQKVLCGTQDGVLGIFSWGDFGDWNDRMVGHPESVQTMLKLDEDTVFTGSSDGLIRIVQILPHKLLGIIGDHDEFPVERIQYSYDKNYLCSCSHDNLLRFWDISFLQESDGEEEEEEGQGQGVSMVDESQSSARFGKEKAKADSTRNSFFDDM